MIMYIGFLKGLHMYFPKTAAIGDMVLTVNNR